MEAGHIIDRQGDLRSKFCDHYDPAQRLRNEDGILIDRSEFFDADGNKMGHVDISVADDERVAEMFVVDIDTEPTPNVWWSAQESPGGAWVTSVATLHGHRRKVLKGVDPDDRAKAEDEARAFRRHVASMARLAAAAS